VLQYTLKRLLLTIPTFFFISLLLFLVLNIAPGRPGAAAQGGDGERGNQEQKESYRIFKEQFNLDKPILLNTRFALEQSEVRELIATGYDLAGKPTAAERIEAQDNLEDYGNYLVRHLVPLLDDSDPNVQQLAAETLTVASQLRFVNERRGDVQAARAENRELSKRNSAVKDWSWGDDATDANKAEVIGKWKGWFVDNESTYTYTTNEKVSAFFFDTRFAKYWSNLIHLDFGVSTADRRPVFETVLSKLKYSLSLTFTSVILAYAISVPIGVFSAIRQGTKIDGVITVVLFIMYSLPTFFTGTVLLRLLTEGEPVSWFPTGDFQTMTSDPMTTWDHLKDILWHLVLPIATYTSVSLATLSR
jgi:peptide/nickel transport system permease protein